MKNDKLNCRVGNGADPNTKKVTFEFTLAADDELIKKANLGTSPQVCKICGAPGDFQTWKLIEMQYGTKDEFRYFECAECGTLQIEKFPENIGDYYSNEYYSYAPPPMRAPNPGAPRDARMILDVGCGAGKWLCKLAEIGCVNLYGCDPFVDGDKKYPNGVRIKKCSIHEMEGKYDLISFNDSLEHMPDPHDVFKSADRLLKHKDAQTGPEAPKLQIILPIHPSLTVDIYGMSSFALDAPRHFFLYTEKALSWLAEKYGFYVESRVNRTVWGHLGISRGYQLGIKWTKFWPEFQSGRMWDDPKKQESLFEALMSCASAVNYSDHAMFTLKRKDDGRF